MPSPDVASPDLAEALLHGQFSGWSRAGGGSSDGNGCPNSPGGGGAKYALTLTHSHLHVQRLSVRPGREARLLLPLAELLGCSCPRHPAPPLLLLYWYPSGRRRKGVSRRRQVRAYLAESRPDAERWCAAVQCLLRGVPVCAATEFNKGLLPRPRRLLLLVNPFSGRGQAMQWCQSHILPMIREASISYNLIQTERQNHAKELVREISLAEWDGIVIVSGDGLLHEVINGLMERPDWEEAIKTPVGILPCGSGNALAGSINHHAGYDMCLREPLLLNCCFLLCRGCVRPMDLVSVTTSRPASNQNGWPTQRRLFSFLSVAWGFVSDVDIESERYRGLGSARFTLGTLVRLASLRSYKGRLSYLPPTAVTASPDATPPPQKRLLSRSITEGLEGFSRTPIHRTISDMGLSEQRSLRKGDEECERERQKEECERERQKEECERERQKEECERERQKERERRRERRRGRARGGGVTRASSLAEDREREREAESEQGGGDAQEGSPPEKDGRTEVGMEDPDSDDREDESATDGKDGSLEDVLEAVEASEQYGAGTGKDECDSCYQERREQRKNSAPSSQIVSAICGPPKAPGPQLECDSGYCAEEAQLNGTYAFPRQPFTLEMRERALTISSPFRHITRSYKPKSVDQNQNSSRPRPLSLLQSNSNSLPPKLSLSMSPPTPPSSPPAAPSLTSTYLAPRPGSPGSASPSPSLRSPSPSFTFDVAEPAGPVKTRTAISEVYAPPRDDLLPPLDQPLPTRDWVTVEGDFVLVLAIYQSHLGADLLAAPQARFDDGLIHLTFVRAGISRATLLRLFLAMERGAHLSLSSPYVSHVSAKAFRLQPLSPRGTLTVDGELVPYGPLQAQVHPSMARLIVGDPGVKITRL